MREKYERLMAAAEAARALAESSDIAGIAYVWERVALALDADADAMIGLRRQVYSAGGWRHRTILRDATVVYDAPACD